MKISNQMVQVESQFFAEDFSNFSVIEMEITVGQNLSHSRQMVKLSCHILTSST